MRPARISVAVLTALLLAAAAEAQVPSPTGNVFGTVQDRQGRIIAGAAATLVGPDAARKTTTDAHGAFRFLGIAPGLYALELVQAGFDSARQEVTVQLGKNAVIEVTLQVAGAREAITIVGEPPSLDSRKVETGATYDEQELRTIPTTRDPWAVLRQVPGVLLGSVDVGDADNGRQPRIVGKGSHPDQNTYNLDGIAISVAGYSPLYFDFDSLDGLAFATGGSDPSLASPGVTLNLVTKRGTNLLRGSARALYTDGARWDYGGEVGGPLWTDHLWLWGAGASNSYPSQIFDLPYGETAPFQETQDYWNAKLSAQLVPSNSSNLSYSKFKRSSDGIGAEAGNRSEPSTWDVTWASQSYRVEDSQVFSERLFASIDFSYLPLDSTRPPKGGLDTQALEDANYIWRNSFYEWDIGIVQRQAGVTASGFFDTGNLRHELKFGFGYRQAHWESSSWWPADELVGYAHEFSQLASITRASNRHLVLNYYDTYLGDTIQAGNLTINAGLRFDYQQGKNLPSSVPANPAFPELLPAVGYAGDSGYPITWRAVQPRVGATYAIGRERKTLLRASYARFANQLGGQVGSINAFPGTAGLYYGWNDANANGRVERGEIDRAGGLFYAQNVDPDDPASYAPINQTSANLEPPTTDEFIVGVEREISSDLSASLAYTHRSLSNPEFSPLIGTTRASYQYIGNATGTALDPATGFILNFNEPYYGLMECPDPCVGTVLENRPNTRETYNGLELQLVKAFSHGWMLRVSVAYNNWQQQIGPGAIVNPNNETPGTNANGPVVEGGINATWQFNVSGMVELPLGIQASLNLFGRQGFPIPYFFDAVTNDLAFSIPTIQIGQATTYRTPNVYVLDLQLSKDFVIASKVAVGPVITCFNVLNSHTVLERNGFVGGYDSTQTPAFDFVEEQFNAVVSRLSGRTLRFGVRISF